MLRCHLIIRSFIRSSACARASEDMRSSFTPLICSTDAVLHREYAAYQKRLASRLATKWDKSYSVVMAWVRVQTQLTIIRADDLHLRGTRRRLVGLQMQDGAGLGMASIHLYFAGKQVGDIQKRRKPEMRSSCRKSFDLH